MQDSKNKKENNKKDKEEMKEKDVENNKNNDQSNKNNIMSKQQFRELKLPISIDIVRNPRETLKVCSSVHACVLAPQYAKMYTFPDFPDYTNDNGTYLLFPSQVCICFIFCF